MSPKNCHYSNILQTPLKFPSEANSPLTPLCSYRPPDGDAIRDSALQNTNYRCFMFLR